MLLTLSTLALGSLFTSRAGAATIPFHVHSRDDGPTATLDQATVQGVTQGGVDLFAGIPFALPPTGDRRFALPVQHPPYNGTVSATSFGPACYQQSYPPSGQEDCLYINVEVPTGTKPNASLPVVAWIYGGGFEAGDGRIDSSKLIPRSVELGGPIIVVSMNYRLSAFGFLGSKEVKAANVANIGLHDQREALRWIQRYISAFGGDPKKVSLWGESAGAISIGYQMVANNGNSEGLFRGAYLHSGTVYQTGDVTQDQYAYDSIVEATSCSSASDTLACLRTVPYDTLVDAIGNTPAIGSYPSLNLAYLPRVDGTFITDSIYQLVEQGKVANIPVVSNTCEDEGTIFAGPSLNITSQDDLRAYWKSNYFPQASDSDMSLLMQAYPNNDTLGSPYDTGLDNIIAPTYKQQASFLGDMAFQAPKRFFLSELSSRQSVWASLFKRNQFTSQYGVSHGSDLSSATSGGDIQDMVIYFFNKLDPNIPQGPYWPPYTTSQKQLMIFLDDSSLSGGNSTTRRRDSGDTRVIGVDAYRETQISFLNSLRNSYPL